MPGPTRTNRNRTPGERLLKDDVLTQGGKGGRLVTLNVRGLLDATKLSMLVSTLKTIKWDVLCLQDTHFILEKEARRAAIALGGKKCKWAFAPGQSHRDGLLAITREETKIIEHEVDKSERTTPGAWLRTRIIIKETTVDIINAYAPRVGGPRKQFLKDLPEKLNDTDTNRTIPQILAGDFNVVLDCANDRINCATVHTPVGKEELNTKTAQNGLSDSYRLRHEGPAWTWKGGTNGKRRTLLDRIFIDDTLTTRISLVNT